MRRLCDPHFGVGSDGVLLLSRSEDPDYVAELRIFNPDGSEAELSGNGAREAILYLRRHGWTDADTSRSSPRPGRSRRRSPRSGPARSRWDEPRPRRRTFPAARDDGTRDADARRDASGSSSTSRSATRSARSWSSGSSRTSTWPRSARRSKARRSSRTAPTSPSCAIDGSRVRARIFERGVGETLSSGTGASGAAVDRLPARRAEPDHGRARRRRARGRDLRRPRRDAQRLGRADLLRRALAPSCSTALTALDD